MYLLYYCRNGDLVHTMYLEITLKKKSSPHTYYPAEQFCESIELEIGGQRIDKVYSDWYRIYDELFRSGDEKLAYQRLTDFDDRTANTDTGRIKRFYLPMIFFFNRHPGLALPLIALQVRFLYCCILVLYVCSLHINSYTNQLSLCSYSIFCSTTKSSSTSNSPAVPPWRPLVSILALPRQLPCSRHTCSSIPMSVVVSHKISTNT